MIKQILTDLKTQSLWQSSQYGNTFYIPGGRTYSPENVLWILKFLNIPVKQTRHAGLHISDNKAFLQLKKAINVQSRSVTALQGNYARYNDLTESDWITFNNHVTVKAYDDNENATPKEVLKSRKNFLQFLRKYHIKDTKTYRLIHEFNHIFSQSKDKKLIIDCSPSAEKICCDTESFAISFAPWDMILLNTDDGAINTENIVDFYHELRHILQYRYHLFTNEWENVPTYKDFAEVLAIEAEATAFDIIYNQKNYPFISKIRLSFQTQLEKEILSDTIKIPVNLHASSAQKAAALIRYIEAATEEKMIQTISQCHLTSSRIDIYNILKKKNIHPSPHEFNRFAQLIDDWKNAYFTMPVEIDKFSQHFSYNKTEIAKTQKIWQQTAQLNFQLEPTRIFSKRMAQCFDIYDKIYDKNALENQPKNIRYHYPNISDKLILEAAKCVINDDLDKIKHIYNFVREKNPFLPIYDTINTPALTPKHIYKAIKTMSNGLNPTIVYRALGYETDDIFDNKFIKYIQKQRINTAFKEVKENIKN